jgi:uncharacterized membrane protein
VILRLLLLALLLCCGQVRAETLARGAVVHGILAVDGKQVVLPAGDWTVAVDAPNGWTNAGLGAFGYIRTIVLFHLQGTRIDAMLEINGNVLPTADGWGMAADCARADLIVAVVRYRAGWDGSCFFVNHTITASESQPAWRAARDFAASNGWRFSTTWLTAGFRAANRSDIVDARFHFAPEGFGIAAEPVGAWARSAWISSRLDSDPARLALAKAVGDWAVNYSTLLDAGLKNRLTDVQVVAMPDVRAAGKVEGLIEHRMAELEAMRAGGAITPLDFETQATALRQSGLGSSSTAPDIGSITAVKALSYRVIVSISHLFVDYYWTGNYVAAGALEVLQITINSAKFYFHELAWAKYVGIPRGDAARTLDFAYMGAGI